MSVIGFDIGTTSICAVLLQPGSDQPVRIEKVNHSFLDETVYSQDPEEIVAIVKTMLEKFWCPSVTDISFSSQMHGIVFLSAEGRAVSDFYTWKNPWGNMPYGGSTYVAYVSEVSDTEEISGHGVVTAFYLAQQGRIPADAVKLTSIGDYVGMRLCGASMPRLNVTLAESIGCFDRTRMDFRREALQQLGLAPTFFPEVVAGDTVYGMYRTARVHGAFGDNQCSFLGSVGGRLDSVLINVGTGQQVSCFSPSFMAAKGVEVRSFFDRGYLYVGVSQNGGKTYERFVRMLTSVAEAFTGQAVDGYACCSRIWENYRHQRNESPPEVVPAVYGSIGAVPSGSVLFSGISERQEAGALIDGYVRGMAEELYCLYQAIPPEIRRDKTRFYASGNGIVKNHILWHLTEQRFGVRLCNEEREEAAAVGAASYVQVEGV